MLEGKAETVENDAEAQELFRAELDAGHPCFGQIVAERIGVKHTQDNADNHRAERNFLKELGFAYVESGAREEADQQHSVEHTASFFSEHRL